MNHYVNIRNTRRSKVSQTALSLVFSFVLSSAAMASGSSGGWNQNGEGSHGSYDIGKKVFMEQVVCETCPYADVVIDADVLAEILPELERDGAIGYKLSYRERKSLISFIEKRFNI